jgi:hypothetical protein
VIATEEINFMLATESTEDTENLENLDMDKKQILNEIRRTAKKNDSIPLGINTFATATGIKRCNVKTFKRIFI